MMRSFACVTASSATFAFAALAGRAPGKMLPSPCGALLKNEQGVSLFGRAALLHRARS